MTEPARQKFKGLSPDEIEFLEQKRFPSKEKNKYNASVKNVLQINRKSFEEVPINHKLTKHKTDII